MYSTFIECRLRNLDFFAKLVTWLGHGGTGLVLKPAMHILLSNKEACFKVVRRRPRSASSCCAFEKKIKQNVILVEP